MSQLFAPESKCAIVTGGARPDGIGWASAMALAQDGYSVMVTGATDEEVSGALDHPSIVARQLDVRNNDAINALFGEFLRLDALITCAGAAGRNTEFTPEGFADIVDINLTGTMSCCLAAQSLLDQTRGAIVTIGSMYSLFGSGIVPAYSASKGGVVQLTKSLAVAWGPNIRVNAVLPGWIQTAMGRNATNEDVARTAIIKRTPAGRLGEPDDLAEVIRFLCGPGSRFVTGAIIPVDGGYHISG